MISLVVLRSKLSHLCGSLQNLTIAELEEGKWSTNKKILKSIIEQCPSLESYCILIEELRAKRELELQAQNQKKVSREVRGESEGNHRTNFIQIVVDALVHLQWPPALEPFSNIGRDLLHEKDIILQAIDYMITVGADLATYVPPSPPSNKVRGSSSSGALSMSRQSDRRSTPNDNTSISFTANCPSSPSGYSTPSQNTSSDHMYHPSLSLSPGSPSIDQYVEDGDVTVDVEEGLDSFGPPIHPEESSSYPHVPLMSKSFHILHKNNEVLLKQLKALQTAVVSREKVELQLSTMMGDLRGILKDIVNTGDRAEVSTLTTDKADREGSKPNANANGSTTTTAAVSNVTDRPRSSTKDGSTTRHSSFNKPPLSKSTSKTGASVTSRSPTTLPPTLTCSGGESGGMWKQLLGSVEGLIDRWDGARRAARRIALELSHPHAATTSPLHKPGTRHLTATNSTSTNSSGLTKDMLFNSGLISSRSASNGSMTNRSSATVMTRSSKYGAPLNTSRSTFSVSSRMSQRSDKIGVSTGKSRWRAAQGQTATLGTPVSMSPLHPANELSTNLSMDPIQWQQLHRDILKVRNCALQCIQRHTGASDGSSTVRSKHGGHAVHTHAEKGIGDSIPIPLGGGMDLPCAPVVEPLALEKLRLGNRLTGSSDGSSGNDRNISTSQSDGPLPLDAHTLQEQLVHASELLVLHSARYAPLMSMEFLSLEHSTADASASSCLVTLADKVTNEYAVMKKSVPTTVQLAIERAFAEQSTLLRCYQRSTSQAKQWHVYGTKLSCLLDTFGSSVSTTFKKGIAALQAFVSSLKSISAALVLAQESVAADGSGGKVNPLQSIRRGCMGPEMSELINTLLLHQEDLSNGQAVLLKVKKQLSIEIANEVQNLTEAKNSLADGLFHTTASQ